MDNDTPDDVRLTILSKAQTLRQDLRRWHHQYISSDDGLRRPSLVSVADEPDSHLFHSAYIYRDTVSASILTTYCAYLIILNREINRLQPDDSYTTENVELARAICMSADYCSHAGYCGTQTMRFSLPIAHLALPVEYHGWTQARLQKFGGIMEASMIQTSHS